EQGVLKEGQYRAVIEDLGTSETYDDHLALVLTLEDQFGEPVEVSSSAFRAIYSSNMITEFSFLLEDNQGKITRDVVAIPNGNHIIIRSPFVLNPAGLVPTWVTNGQKVLVNGVEQQNGVTPQNFTNPVVYQVISADGEVNSYTVSVSTSGLPILEINTPESKTIASKTEWMDGATISITMPDGTTAHTGNLSIKGRGNTNWSAPKKPYSLKLEQGSKLIDMPKDKRWTLLANWYDRTLLRNDVAFEVARRTHLEWTPRGKYVELVLNGRYMGNYYLCEKIKIDKNRLNLNEMRLEDNEGESITGGYVMELDTYMDEQHTFRSQTRNLPFMFKEPSNDVLNEAKINYMQQFIADLETALYKADWLDRRDYAEMFDIDSSIDYFIVCELVQNTEPTSPKSTYLYKDKNGKLKTGPIWDCDYATFSTYWADSAPMTWAVYYDQLLKDPVFVARLKERWQEYKPQMQTIPDYIRAQAKVIKPSAELNNTLWPISSRVNGDETLAYDEAVARMITYFNAKLEWFDKWVAGL
ncbi:MAG: CotH kinase family protein, partial [Prevotella sp.]|nr:CotH kinase family protein [Prevotella sp.]